MFKLLSLLTLAAPLMVSALTLTTPKNPTSGGILTIKWTSGPHDPPTWSFELVNVGLNDAFAIANNVNPSTESLTLTLPIVPAGSGYTLRAVNIRNINDIIAETSDFSIGADTTNSA